MADGEKKYTQNGKTIKIIPLKRVKKTETTSATQKEEKVKPERAVRQKKEKVPGKAKFAVDDKVSLKNIPPEYAGAGFTESVITKVFKSSYDQTFRYSIRATTGQELAMLKEEQLKLRK